MLGPVDAVRFGGISWVIVGGESGPGHRSMEIEWIRDVRDRCERSDIAFFFKQCTRAIPGGSSMAEPGTHCRRTPGSWREADACETPTDHPWCVRCCRAMRADARQPRRRRTPYWPSVFRRWSWQWATTLRRSAIGRCCCSGTPGRSGAARSRRSMSRTCAFRLRGCGVDRGREEQPAVEEARTLRSATAKKRTAFPEPVCRCDAQALAHAVRSAGRVFWTFDLRGRADGEPAPSGQRCACPSSAARQRRRLRRFRRALATARLHNERAKKKVPVESIKRVTGQRSNAIG